MKCMFSWQYLKVTLYIRLIKVHKIDIRGEYKNEICKDSIITKNIVSILYSLKHNMKTGVASLRNDSVVNTRNFLSSAFYRYSVDHCSSLPNKRGAIQITYCIYLLLRNSCLRRTTVTARIWKNLYVTGIVKNICVGKIIVKGNFVIDACWSHVPVSFRSYTKRFQWERHRD